MRALPAHGGRRGPLTFGGFASAASAEQGYIASASYQLEGGATIRLGIYTIRGNLCTGGPAVRLGAGGGSLLREQDTLIQAPQAKLGQGRRQARRLHSDRRGVPPAVLGRACRILYLPRDESPRAACESVDYGVSVRADGKLYRLRARQSPITRLPPCYEEFTASLPTGTRAVTVEANDAAGFLIIPPARA
jgi:hypothetical protein